MTALSGGERRRLALALVVASGANFLVLDEPTNHLDLESRESLENALAAFPGSVLLVTHDRALLDAVSARVIAIEEGQIVSYPGGWAEVLERRAPAPAPPKEPKPKKPAPPPKPKPKGATPLELVEREIARTEERIAELERQLAEDWTNVDLVGAHRAARNNLTALFARWESMFEAN
jgi:ATP-binding cassette subfamily F protein 3